MGPVRGDMMEDIVMSESAKILWTSGLTVVGGVFVFVIGRIIERFIIETIYDLKTTRKEIQYSLRLYGPQIHNPGIGNPEELSEVSEKLRDLGARLPVKIHAIPYYRLFRTFRLVPQSDKLYKVANNMVELSNTVRAHPNEELQGKFPEHNRKLMDEINQLMSKRGEL